MGKGGGMRWTEAELLAHQKRGKTSAEWDKLAAGLPKKAPPNQDKLLDALVPKPTGKAKLQALGRLRDGSMNKTEARYAQYLDVLKHECQILWWAFEAIKLKLADRTYLTVDFAVMTAAGELHMIDVKGAKAIVEDDARVKMKCAREKFPFAFFMVFPNKATGGWITEEI